MNDQKNRRISLSDLQKMAPLKSDHDITTFTVITFVVIYKWRHAISDNFWPPLSPIVTHFITMALVLSSQNLWPLPLRIDVIYGRPLSWLSQYSSLKQIIYKWSARRLIVSWIIEPAAGNCCNQILLASSYLNGTQKNWLIG